MTPSGGEHINIPTIINNIIHIPEYTERTIISIQNELIIFFIKI